MTTRPCWRQILSLLTKNDNKFYLELTLTTKDPVTLCLRRHKQCTLYQVVLSGLASFCCVLHHVSQQDLITSQPPVRPAVASHSSGSPRQQVTENMMVSKAAMKFSQNHPAQHEKLLEVIRTAKAGDSLGQQRANQQGTEKQRQTWSTRMIFTRKVEH